MEQCLAKSMPLQRAVWLAKCVGANELRSFRRKGVSGSAAAQGETKWVRDWTIQVEQFLESIANTCGQENWRAKIDYAIKLASAFYSEGLLDRDEYLDWLVRTFASATLATLPLWIIIVQIYWRDLITIGRRGRRLASALLEHLHHVVGKNNSAFETLKGRLQKLITGLATTANGCLILPHVWKKYGKLLDQELPALGEGLQHVVASIKGRNERLAAPMGRTADTTSSPLLNLYAMLDGISMDVDLDKLPSQCLSLVPDTNDLVGAVLHWSSTVYRYGRARVYIAARIIAYMYYAGYDTTGSVLAYLQQSKDTPLSEARHIWSVIGDLLHHDAFAVGAYLQWIITSGAAFRPGKSTMATGLLATLPVEKIPRRLRNLRCNLLERLGQSTDEEVPIEKAKQEILQAFGTFRARFEDADGHLASLSGSAKLAVSSWMCQELVTSLNAPTLSASTFAFMRSIFENFGDLRALARLVEAALLVEDAQLLASAADTINMHVLDFVILGDMSESLDRLMERHRVLRRTSLERTSLLAYVSLIKRFPDRAQDAQLLASDLVAYEQQHSAAVCSPASDNLIGMQAGNLDSDAEIDAVFASGNSMDEQTMQRVFLRVLERAGKSDVKTVGLESNVHKWLDQLRNVDGPGFEKLAWEYVSAIMIKSQGSGLNTAGVVALVANRCLGFEALNAMSIQASSKTAAAALELMAAPVLSTGLGVVEDYSFKLQQQRFSDEHAEGVINLLHKASEDQSFSVESDWVLDLSLQMITGHPDRFRERFTEDHSSLIIQQAATRISEALLSRGQSRTAANLDACQVIRSANALNTPFSISWLHTYVNSQTMAGAGEEDAIKSALLKAVADKSEVWPQLLSAAKAATLKEIHVWARSSILAAVNAQDGDPMADKHNIGMLRQVLDVTYDSITDEDDAQFIWLLTEGVKAQEKPLNGLDAMAPDYQSKLSDLVDRISVFLHLCTLPAQTVAVSDQAKQGRTQLVAALCSLLVHPRLEHCRSLTEHIHDVAALHADALPEETLSSLYRQLQPTTLPNNTTLRFLLGSLNMSPNTVPTPSLALSSRVQAAQQTQQQRALARRQPQVAGGGAGANIPGASVAGASMPGPSRPAMPNANLMERKLTPYPLRNWEIMPDPTPVMGENDCALSLGLFGARKV